MGSSDTPAPVFSFTFNAEILSFLGGALEPEAEIGIPVQPQPQFPQTSFLSLPLFEILGLHKQSTDLKTRIISVIQYSAVTTGVLIAVGLGSYCVYNCLQGLRSMEPGAFHAYVSNPGAFRDFIKMKLTQQQPQSENEERIANVNGSKDGNQNESMTIVTSASAETISQKLKELVRNAGAKIMRTNSDPQSTKNEKGQIVNADEHGDDIQTEYFGPAMEEGSEEQLQSNDIAALANLFRESYAENEENSNPEE